MYVHGAGVSKQNQSETRKVWQTRTTECNVLVVLNFSCLNQLLFVKAMFRHLNITSVNINKFNCSIFQSVFHRVNHAM